MTQTVDTFFEGGATAAKFADGAYGTVIGGEIVADPRMVQQRDYTTGDPISYPDGNPAMQMIVVVQVSGPVGDDDGQRALYIKGQMKQAVGEALRKVGVKSPARGGRLFIRYAEDKPTTLKNGRPGNPQKIYVAKYEPPAATQAGAYFDEPASSSTTPTTRGADGSAKAGAGAVWPACPPGVDAGKWGVMTSEQKTQMYGAFGLAVPAAATFSDEPPF